MPRLISRDPFARTELHRKIHHVFGSREGCDWCGQQRLDKAQPYLYKYVVEHDGGRREDVPGLFCSISCMRSHNG